MHQSEKNLLKGFYKDLDEMKVPLELMRDDLDKRVTKAEAKSLKNPRLVQLNKELDAVSAASSLITESMEEIYNLFEGELTKEVKS